MKVLGIDPGLRVSGYAVLEQRGVDLQVVDAGTIKVDPAGPLSGRLVQIYQDVNALLDEYEVDVVAVEELYAHYKHPRTAILMGHARGVVLLAAAQHGVKVVDFAATRIKKSLTGVGRASKQQMQRSVTQQLGLNKLPSPPDIADAMAIAMCCLNEHSREKTQI